MISFYLAMKKFDQNIKLNLIDFYADELTVSTHVDDHHNEDKIVNAKIITFDGNFLDINREVFIEDYKSLLLKYNLNCYQYRTNEVSEIVFAFTADDNYLNKQMLFNGKLEAILDKTFVSSDNNIRDKKLVKPLANTTITIASIDAIEHEQFSILGPYYITGHNKNEIDKNISKMKLSLSELYPNITVKINEVSMSISRPSEISDQELILFVLISLLLYLCLNTEVLRNTKTIVVKKLNGWSNARLYYHYVIKMIFIVVGLLIVSYLVIYFSWIPLAFNKGKYLITQLILFSSSFIIILLTSTSLILYSIQIMNPNIVIKGKNLIVKQWKYLIVLKVIFTVMTFSILLTGANSVQRIVRAQIQENNYLVEIENIYRLGPVKLELRKIDSSNIDNHLAASNYLIKNNNMFLFNKVDESNLSIPVYQISENFLKKYGIEYPQPEKENLILIPKTIGMKSIEVVNWVEDLKKRYSMQDIDIEEYSASLTPIMSFETNNYLSDKNIESAIYWIIYDSNLFPSSNNYFYYDELDVQEYVNNIMQEHDITNYFTVQEVSVLYNQDKLYSLYSEFPKIGLSILVIIIHILLALQIVKLDSEVHGKKHGIRLIEGDSNLKLLDNYIIIEIFNLLLSELVLSLYLRYKIIDILKLSLILMFLNIVIYLIYINNKSADFKRRLQ